MTAEELPEQFRVTLQDASLAPELLPNDELLLDRSVQPCAGDLVLLRDPSGAYLVRLLQELLPGRWIAVSPNPAFASLDIDALGISIVAVSIGETRKRRRSGP